MHKIQAKISMEQREGEMGRNFEESLSIVYINQMKKKTKKKNENMGFGVVKVEYMVVIFHHQVVNELKK